MLLWVAAAACCALAAVVVMCVRIAFSTRFNSNAFTVGLRSDSFDENTRDVARSHLRAKTVTVNGAVLVPDGSLDAHLLRGIARLAQSADMYVLINLESCISKDNLKAAFESLSPGDTVHEHKMLAHSTATGLTAFIRQLEPDLHIENSFSCAKELSRFVRQLVVISSDTVLEQVPNIIVTEDINTFSAW